MPDWAELYGLRPADYDQMTVLEARMFMAHYLAKQPEKKE